MADLKKYDVMGTVQVCLFYNIEEGEGERKGEREATLPSG